MFTPGLRVADLMPDEKHDASKLKIGGRWGSLAPAVESAMARVGSEGAGGGDSSNWWAGRMARIMELVPNHARPMGDRREAGEGRDLPSESGLMPPPSPESMAPRTRTVGDAMSIVGPDPMSGWRDMIKAVGYAMGGQRGEVPPALSKPRVPVMYANGESDVRVMRTPTGRMVRVPSAMVEEARRRGAQEVG